MAKPKAFTVEEIADIDRSFVFGHESLRSIRDRYRVDQRRLRALVEERDMVIRRGIYLDERIMAMWEDGEPIAKISKELKVSSRFIAERRDALGLDPKRIGMMPARSRNAAKQQTSIFVASQRDWVYIAGAFDAGGAITRRNIRGHERHALLFHAPYAATRKIKELLGGETGTLVEPKNGRKSTLSFTSAVDVLEIIAGIKPHSIKEVLLSLVEQQLKDRVKELSSG